MDESSTTIVLASALSVIGVFMISMCVLVIDVYWRCFKRSRKIHSASPNLESGRLEEQRRRPTNSNIIRNHFHEDNSLKPNRNVVISDVSGPNCPHFRLCKEYLGSLEFRPELLNDSYNFCYCSVCVPDSKPNHHKTKRANVNTSGIIKGWAQFGLRVSRINFRQLTCYYGVRTPQNLAHIVQNRTFIVDVNNKVSTSPSIQYVSHGNFATKQTFKSNNRTAYKALVIIKCKQMPHRYAPTEAQYRVKDLPDPQELVHWLSDPDSIKPYAIMVRITKQQ